MELLINTVKCHKYTEKNYALNAVLKDTSNFFGELKLDYASKNLNNTLTEINTKITEHIKNTSKIISIRHKRELQENSGEGINVFTGFHDLNRLNFVNVQDIKFFSLQNEFETIWFAVVLDISKVSLYQINNDVFYDTISYPVVNGKQIFVNSCPYGALLIIQNQNGSVILSFTKVLNNYYLQPVHDFELNDINHLTIWNGMNRLHLGTVSHSNISIYIWFDNYFDLIQVIDVGSKKLIPFQSKGFMYLAVTGSSTLIFKYSLRTNKFVMVQKLPLSENVSYFQLTEGHFTEHYLTLSTESFTVIYKEIHDRFIPFQQISSGNFILPVISRKAIILLTLHKDTIVAYQYNGWRFIELNAKLSGISQFRRVILYNEELLLMRSKDNKWTLKQPLWIKKKSNKNLQEEIRVWNINAKNRIQRAMKEIPMPKDPITILSGHIDQLYVHNINRHNLQQLKDLYKQYKKLTFRFQAQKVDISNKWHPKIKTISSLHAKTIQVNCKTKCKINRLNVKENMNFLTKLVMSIKTNQELNFDELSIEELSNWKCPLLSLPIEDIIVSELINGITLGYLQENALKVTGDQLVSGKHIFTNMKATNAFMPLNIATFLTKQDVTIKEMKVKELNLTTGGILLPLNGSFSTVTGSIKTPKLKIKNIDDLRGKIEGKWKRLSPTIFVSEPMILYNNFTLENVKIDNLTSTDLIASKTGSIKSTLSNAISLHDNISVSLILSSEKMKWSNITVYGFKKWITVNFQNISIISGNKHFHQNVEITKFSYNKLKSEKQDLFLEDSTLCATSVIAPEIKTTTLIADIIAVKKLNSSQIVGNLGEDYFIDNFAVVFKSILSEKLYYHNLTAKNIFTTQLNNLNLTELERLVNSWIEPNILNTSIEATNLKTNTLRLPVRFYIELDNKIIKNLILEQHVYVDYINNINMTDFLDNAIRLTDMKSLQNIIFRSDFSTNHIHASHLPFHLIDTEKDLNLHKKRISGNIEANAINLPYSFKIAEDETPVNIFINGSARFPLEPAITNVNNIRLEKLFTEIWLTTNVTTLYGKNLHFENIVINGNVILDNEISTLNIEMWKNISKRVLSKTKLQEISYPVSLNNIEVPFIVGSNVSRLKSSLSDLNDIFENSLLKDKDQQVKAKWTFHTLKVLGNLRAKHTINKLDLKKDVMRYDSRENIVTGKKTVIRLAAENLNGYNFDKWAANALTKLKKHAIIKGQKTFITATFSDIEVSGTVMGNTIEEVLTKSTNQRIYGQKKFQGSINASELIVSGLINDVNLTELVDHQLKKNNHLQTIKTEIEFQNSLHIHGDLIIKDTYGGAELKNFYTSYLSVLPIAEKMKIFLEAAETINTALQNRAVYINKLEVVEDTIVASNKSEIIQPVQCKSTNSSSHCFSKSALNGTVLTYQTNDSDFHVKKLIVMDEKELIVFVNFDSVSISLFSNIKNELVHSKELHIPRIMEAFAEPRIDTLWIILRLTTQTLVLRYQPWEDLQEYVLPVTDVFEISTSPNNQLLLLLSDGVWDLEGLASPRNIIGIPLKEKVETFVDEHNFYVQCTSKNNTTLMKARYIGN
ncbi:uncharacterized protein LOC126874764 isoform X2 [Bombus huntii]|uniref:uncharacterized protein LOC126874764 isoform X2 n=1 Tax=Bombus huntii TaxID=85661 RepID=UPI0021A9C82E|nr:uncharacterized protein LOC126874764 isoform X2 [Bombus huntii]